MFDHCILVEGHVSNSYNLLSKIFENKQIYAKELLLAYDFGVKGQPLQTSLAFYWCLFKDRPCLPPGQQIFSYINQVDTGQ